METSGIKTSNPALSTKAFAGFGRVRDVSNAKIGHHIKLSRITNAMTLQGTINKTGILMICVLVSFGWIWNKLNSLWGPDPNLLGIWFYAVLILGFIVGLITIFFKSWAAVTGPIYCSLEGLLLGYISFFIEQEYPGIAVQAVCLTFGVFLSFLFAYKSGMIVATNNFKRGVIIATLGIAVFYFFRLILLLNHTPLPFVFENGLLGIGVSLFVVGVAALNLILDFDVIEKGVAQGAPKYMEWYGAFGLMVTLIWLYIEILNLLAKIRSR